MFRITSVNSSLKPGREEKKKKHCIPTVDTEIEHANVKNHCRGKKKIDTLYQWAYRLSNCSGYQSDTMMCLLWVAVNLSSRAH